MSQAKRILRPILKVTRHMNPGHEKHWAVGGSLTLHLSGCGHEDRRKMSQGVPKRGRVHCKECERLRNGSTTTTTQADGSRIRETWNVETGYPLRTILPSAEVSI